MDTMKCAQGRARAVLSCHHVTELYVTFPERFSFLGEIMIDLEYAQAKLQQRRHIARKIFKVINGGFRHSSTPTQDLMLFNKSNRDAATDAMEQFTAEEIVDFMIELVDNLSQGKMEFGTRPSFDDLHSLATDLRHLANEAEDTIRRMERGR